MADTKITALAAITVVDPAADVLPIVDISDTSMAASGTTKKITSNQILQSGGVATLASATITGAATVGTTLGVTGVSTLASAVVTGDLTVRTTGLTVNSSGVGIGTSSQSSFLGNSPKKLVIGDGTQTPALTLYGGSGTYGGIYFADGIVGNETYRGFIEYDHVTDSFNFGKSGASAMILNASGNLAFPTGKGIDFSAVTGGTGTATANVLNDYEEGTWTGTLKGGTTDPTTAVTATGQYTKIGNQVFARILFSNIITTGASGAITVTGLPFANGSNRTIGSTLCDLIATFTGSPICWVGGTGTTLNYQASNSNGAASDLTHNAGTGRYFYSTIVYTV